jgi:hypothetical protein
VRRLVDYALESRSLAAQIRRSDIDLPSPLAASHASPPFLNPAMFRYPRTNSRDLVGFEKPNDAAGS